jgi:hypothetical protein
MHRRFGDPALFDYLFGCPGRYLRRVDAEPALALQGARCCLHTPLDFFIRHVSGCTRDPCHNPSVSEWVPSFTLEF